MKEFLPQFREIGIDLANANALQLVALEIEKL
jgi:hypothetical protein